MAIRSLLISTMLCFAMPSNIFSVNQWRDVKARMLLVPSLDRMRQKPLLDARPYLFFLQLINHIWWGRHLKAICDDSWSTWLVWRTPLELHITKARSLKQVFSSSCFHSTF